MSLALMAATHSLAQPPGTMPAGAMPLSTGQSGSGSTPSQSPTVGGQNTDAGGQRKSASDTNTSPAGTEEADPEAELNIKAFLLLDEAGNPVIMPGMSFEKLDELQRMQQGWRQLSELYTIESLEVRGRVVETIAEMTVTVRIDLEPTGDKWVTVPLRMGNFHRQGPADVSGIERYRLDLGKDGAGYLLHLKSDTRRNVVIALRVKGVVSPPPSSAVEFRLPEAPSQVNIEVPLPGVSATVIGRGDEVLETKSQQNTTEVALTSGGGIFSLRFGTQLPVVDTRPVLESESRILVDWQQADNAPIVSQEIAVRSGRGDLRRFELAIPPGVPLLQQPTIRGNSPFEIEDRMDTDLGGVLPGNENPSDDPLDLMQRRMIGVVPTGERGDSRVEIGIATQVRSADGRPGGMITIQSVAVADAIEQTGEIEVRTPRDYRLRWTPQPWVTSQWDQPDADSGSTRTYRFRFDRVPFELPLWLSARAKRLRVEGDYRLTFFDSLASLKLLLRTSGGVPDSRILALNVAGWRVQSTFVGGSTAPVQVDQIGDLLEIDLASLPSGGESDRIEITLVRPFADSLDRVELSLPQIASDPELVGTIASTLSVVTQADYRFIADLSSSLGIGDVLRAYGPGGSPESTSGASTTARPNEPIIENRYALPDISQPSRLAGFLVTERPRIAYQAEADISISGNQLIEDITWVIYPQGGLRGRFPVAWGRGESGRNEIPTINADSLRPDPSHADVSRGSMPRGGDDGEIVYRLPTTPLWTVTVDEMPAVLRAGENNEHNIISDHLATGPHRVRLRRSRELPAGFFVDPSTSFAGRVAGVELPRPGVADVTLRGPVTVRLRGDRGIDLVWREPQTNGAAQTGESITLASQPITELAVGVRRVNPRQEEPAVVRAVLRSAVSRDTQHDYLIASVQGGGLLRLPLQNAAADVLARATVNGTPTEVLRIDAQTCSVRLGEKGKHTVTVQIWAPRQSSLIAEKIQPVLSLPTGTERFYWEIVTPQDDHLVWASPSTGRAMRWQFDRWRLYRQPVQTAAELATWAGASWETRLPPGNRYLFVGVDASGLQAVMMSRMAIWLIAGSAVLMVSCLLTYFPRARHPLLAVVGAVLLSGMTLLLPDASVIAGQVMLVAMLMVAVMAGVGYLLAPKRPTRVLVPASDRAVDRADRSSVRSGSPSRGNVPNPTSQSAPSGQSGRLLAPEALAASDSRPRGSAAEARS